MGRVLILVLLAMLCGKATGANVVRVNPGVRGEIVVSPDTSRPWAAGDRVCVTIAKDRSLCGRVTKLMTPAGYATVQLIASPGLPNAPAIGASAWRPTGADAPRSSAPRLSRQSPPTPPPPPTQTVPPRVPAAATATVAKTQAAPVTTAPPSNFFAFGLSYLFPTLQYQMAISPTWALGAMPMYVSYRLNDGTLRGFGALLTATHYPSGGYRDLWVQIGTGFFSLEAINGAGRREKFTSPAVSADLGWRWMWPGGLNLGCGIGAQFLFEGSPSAMPLDFAGVLPSIVLDLGLVF